MFGILNLYFSIFLLLSEPASATPTVKIRSVSSTEFQNFNLFEQYSCAAYDAKNFEKNAVPPSGTVVTCAENSCPLVHAATTNILTEFSNPGITDVTGFVAADLTNKLIIVSFRGSSSLDNWITNLNVERVKIDDICSGCEAHAGFWASWVTARDQAVLTALNHAILKYQNYHVVVTGHSLGGAIATLAAAQLRHSGFVVALYNYGSPMVGNKALATFITNQSGGNYRITHFDDPVPQLPSLPGYRHISPEYWISKGNNVPVTASDIQDLPNDNGDVGSLINLDISAHLWYFNHISSC